MSAYSLSRSGSRLLQGLVRRRSSGLGACTTSQNLLPKSARPCPTTSTTSSAASFSAAAAAAVPSTPPGSIKSELGRVVKLTSNSRLANRDDIKAAVTTALEGGQVKTLDPILFKGIYPSNAWLVELSSREAAHRLVRYGQIHAAGGVMKVEELREEEAARLQVASELGLDDCCIQLQHVPLGMGVDEVAYFFRNFQVSPKGIWQVETTMRQPSMAWHKKTGGGRIGSSVFLVRFATADEAQRAIRERQFEKWGDRRIQIIPYK